MPPVLGAWRSAAVLLSAVLFVVSAHSAQAGVNVWTTHGPYGGAVQALAIDPTMPTTLYAGTGNGVYKSTDAGNSWRAAWSLTGAMALAIDPKTPSTLYAGFTSCGMGCNGGVLKSTDSGGSWTAFYDFTPYVERVHALAIDPHTPSTLYVGTNTGGVLRSTDSGASWSAVNTGLPIATYINVGALAIDPHTPSALYAGIDLCDGDVGCAPGGVFRSTDSGGSWSAVNSGLTSTHVTTVAIDPTTPSTLYAGTDGGVFRSANSGANWSAVSSGLTHLGVSTLAIDPTAPSTLYAGTDGGVFRSTDSAGRWTASGLTDTQADALAIDPHSPSTLYAGTAGGVFQSTNSAGSWSAVNSGLTSVSPIYALAIDPQTPSVVYAGAAGIFGTGVFRSTDSGASWSPVLTSTWVDTLAIDPHTPSTLYAGTQGSGVFQSTNSGASWTAISSGLVGNPPSVYSLAIDPQTPSTLYAGTFYGVFQSTDSGAHWSAVSTGLPNNTRINALVIDPSTPSTLYAGTYGAGVFQSSNSGASWSAVNTGLATPYVFALAIDPHTPGTLYAGTGYAGTYGGVFRSTNSGGTWSAVLTGLPSDASVTALAIDPHAPSTLYAGTYHNGVLQSTDSGGSWSAVNTGLPDNASVGALAIDPKSPSRLYAGAGNAVFDIELTCVVGTGTSPSCTEAALDACLPGGAGFNGAVTFDCGASPVTITVSSTKTISASTSISGGGFVTLSGGGTVLVFVVNEGVTLNLHRLTISGRSPTAYGGAIYNNHGTLTITNSTFSGNTAQALSSPAVEGGVIENNGILTVTDSTFSGTAPVRLEAGAYERWRTAPRAAAGGGFGGAIFNNGGTLIITNSTFSGNSANAVCMGFPCGGAGAIYNAGLATLTNTIVASSSSGDNCSGPITDGGHNLDDGTSCGFSAGTGSLNNTDPKLDPAGLASNGGPTLTIALLPGSPAINAGDQAICAAPPVNGVDQRGYVRPGTGSANCSIGAFEFNSPGPLCDVGDCNSDGQVTIDELITLVNIALGNAQPSACPHGVPSGAEVNVALIIQAVNNALTGCTLTSAEQGCLTSGGTVASASCCVSTGDFPDTCGIGACGCAPAASHDVRVCTCGAGSCFDGSGCVRE